MRKDKSVSQNKLSSVLNTKNMSFGGTQKNDRDSDGFIVRAPQSDEQTESQSNVRKRSKFSKGKKGSTIKSKKKSVNSNQDDLSAEEYGGKEDK